MTLPNGSAGVNPQLQWGVAYGEVQNLPARTQDAVTAILKGQVQLSAAWTAASAAVYEGLRSGINYALAIIEAIVQRLFATVETFPGVSQALDFIQHVPGVQELTHALTGVTGDLNDLATYVAGKWNTLAQLVNDIADFIAAAGQTALADVGTALVNAANLAQTVNTAIGALITNVGGTVIGDVSTAINTAATNAGDAISQLNDLIVGAGGVDIGDVATQITAAANNAAAATADLIDLIAGMGAADIHGVVSGLLATANAADNAVNDLSTLITGVLGGSHTIGDLVAYLNAIPGSAIAGITAVEQAILDAIANALGHSGTGHTPTDIEGYLANIPGSVITGITGGLQTTLDAIANALGISGTGHTPANVQTYLGAIPGGNITGSLNTALTVSGNAIGTLLQYLNSSGQFAAGQLTGAINGSLTLGGVTLSTLVTNINSSGQLLAAGITGALGTGLTVGGVTLGTLFTNINSAGQLVLAGATGALNTAVTIGGQAVSTIFNGSGQFIGVLNSAATGVLNTAITVNSQAIGTVQANAQGLVQGINNAAAGVLSGASSLLADAQTNVNLLFTSAPLFLQGLSGVFGQTATNDAYAAAAAAQAAAAAELARQTSAFNAVFNVSPTTAGNVSVNVDFSGMANASNMSGVMSPGNTNMGITSGAAARKVSTTGSDKEVFPTTTTTDYQLITVTLGPLNDLSSGSAPTTILCRSNSARTTYVEVVINYNAGVPKIGIQAEVSGSTTGFVPLTAVPTMASGGVIKIFMGDPASSSPYAMQVLYNNTPVITYTDSSHVSQIGASYQYTGLRMVCNSAGKYPPAIRSITYQDNPPPPAAYPFSGRPTASVDAKGRQYASSDCGRIDRDNGGAWENIYLGPLAWATAPPTSGWSWSNQGGASVAADADALLITAPSGTRNWRLRTRSLSPTSNYTAAAYFEAAGVPVAGANMIVSGIGLRNSSSGSFISFGPYLFNSAGYFSNLAIYRWTNATTVSALTTNMPAYILMNGKMPNWLRIRDDGSNRYFEYSDNGNDWILFYSEGRTAFITPDQFFFGADNEGSGQDVKVRLRSLSGIA